LEKNQNEMEKADSMIEELDRIKEILSIHYSKMYSKNIEKRHIFYALFILLEEKHNLEWPGNLWDINLDLDDAKKLLNDFDFDIIINGIEIDKDIFPKSILVQYKAMFKAKGLIWIINKYDPDPFPSNPHAHQLDNNIKLDLSNGKCYKKKVHIHTITTKDLLKIRKRASTVYKGELPRLEK